MGSGRVQSERNVQTRPLMRALRVVAVLAATAGLTFLCFRLFGVNATTAALLFLILILLIATEWGLVEAVSASVAAVLCFNYFFLPPVGTLTIADPQNWVALFAFLATAIIASQLSHRARVRALEATSRGREMERLYELSRALLLTDDRKPLAAELARHIVRIFDCGAVAVYDRELGQVFRAGSEEGNVSDQRLQDSALQSTVFHDNVPGATTLPVTLGGQSAGSISVPDTAFSDPALHAIVNLCAISLEREKAQAGVNRAEAWRKSEELKATLLDALAHEFKTPLTSIKASATALLGRAGEGLGQERELLSVIDEEAGRLDDMVTESIQLARIEAGKLQLQRRPERVADLLESAVKGCAHLLEGRVVECVSGTGLRDVEADRELILLVLRQLLSNAVKYSAPGTPIRVEGSGREGAVVVAVTNQGPAIAEREQSMIFEKFYRTPEVRGRIPGTGMGLTIAREIVQAHKGRIWVESHGGSTRFSFSLPEKGA